MIMDINQPFVTQEQKFKYWEESKAEIKALRAKVASAEVLVEALKLAKVTFVANKLDVRNVMEVIDEALATYDKLSEVKHDTK